MSLNKIHNAYYLVKQIHNHVVIDKNSLPMSIVVLNIFIFIIFFGLAFFLRERGYDYIWTADMSYFVTLAEEHYRVFNLNAGLKNDILQSLGNIQFPCQLLLIPSFVIPLILGNGTYNPSFANTIMASMLFLSTIFLSRTLGFNWLISLGAGWLIPMISLPVFGDPKIYPILILSPLYATGVSINSFIVALFVKIGNSRLSASICYGLIILAMVVYLLLSMPTHFVLHAPILLIVGIVSILLSIKNKGLLNKEIIFKICFVLVTILILYAIGFLHHLWGLFKYTALSYFPLEMKNDRMSWSFVSIFFHSHFNRYFFLYAILGALFVFATNYKDAHLSSLVVLIFSTLIVLCGTFSVYFDWRGPSPIYFEFYLWPFYAIFFSYFILVSYQIISYLISRFLRLNLFCIKKKFIYLIMPSLFVLLFGIISIKNFMGESKSQHIKRYPPERTPIINVLENNIGLSSSTLYRGRVLTLTGRNLVGNVGWLDLHGLDGKMIDKVGNDHRMVGLWFYGIPSLFEHNSLISPAFYTFTKVFLSKPGDLQMRSVMVWREFHLPFLQTIGVRYIISDDKLPIGKLREQISLYDNKSLFLYEVPNPNIGNYSPVKVFISKNLEDTLSLLKSPQFQPTTDVVLNSPVDVDLVNTTSTELFVNNGDVFVRAKSEGMSLLVLPFEFSHCLTITNLKATTEFPKLFRVNGLLTGVLFNRQIDIKINYFTGAFRNASCRIRDSEEFNRLINGSN
jgi:hypothetical protein